MKCFRKNITRQQSHSDRKTWKRVNPIAGQIFIDDFNFKMKRYYTCISFKCDTLRDLVPFVEF